MAVSKAELVARMVRKAGVFRPRELDRLGIARQYLRQAKDRGLVRQVGRGLYVADGSRVDEHHTLVEAANACRMVSSACCRPSAFMGSRRKRRMRFGWPSHTRRVARAPTIRPMRIVHFSGKALSYGVEDKKLEGVTVRVFGPAKTVADCFKYRNKIGLEVALEALRDCYRQGKATMDELFMAAKICRVARVMQPYLESPLEENCSKCPRFGPSAIVESGDGTEGRFWTCGDPLWTGTIPISPQRFSPSRFVCPQGRATTATLDRRDVPSNPRS